MQSEENIMKIFILTSCLALTISHFTFAADTKQDLSPGLKITVEKKDDESSKIKEQARLKVIQKLDKYKKKLDNYLKSRSQDEAAEGIPGEYEKVDKDIRSRIEDIESRKQKLLNKINQKYDFSKKEAAQKTAEKIDKKLKAIKEKAFENLPHKQIN